MDIFLEDDDLPNAFTRFALSKVPYSLEDFLLLNQEIAEDPTVTGEILTSEKFRALFLSDFSEIIERIITWLGYLQKSQSHRKYWTTNEATIHNFASNFVAPLLDCSCEEYHTLSEYTTLLTITIQLSYTYRRHGVGPKTHKTLLQKISNSPCLIRQILPSIDGANLIQKILAEAQAGAEMRSFGLAPTLRAWTLVAVELCSQCRGNHGVNEELSRWNSLLCLQESLTSILEAENEKRRVFPRLNVSASGFSGMRELSKDDKKSGVAVRQGDLPTSFSLSPADHDNLAVFNLKVPTGIASLEGILVWLEEKESFRLFHALMQSLPCALCLRGEISRPAPALPPKAFSIATLPDSFTGILFGQKLGPWKINLSERAFKDLQLSNKEGYLGGIARKLRDLASGHWDLKSLRRPLSQKMLEEANEIEQIPLWRAVYGSSGRILWQVNLAFDEDEGKESQVVTVWRIGESHEVRKSIRHVLQLQKGYSESHKNRCLVNHTRVPVIPTLYEDTEDLAKNMTQIDETIPEAEEALISSRFYSMTGKVLDRLLVAPDAAEFPFDISMEETEIIKHSNTAAFILGRSGTGKTTCLLFKLLCRNVASRDNGETVRQIFLTRSSFLAERLEHYLQRLIQSQRKSDSTPGQSKQPQRPNLGKQEYTLTEAKDPFEGLTLENMDSCIFPLVCTFDQLFSFLEKVIRLNDRKDFGAAIGGGRSVGSDKGVRRLVDYNVFSSQYWQKYYHHGQGPEPDLVFAEILGVIKGRTSVQRGFEPLSKEEYVRLTQKVAPVFTDEGSREDVYRMYEAYEREKHLLGDQDDIDRVSYLMRCLEADQDLKKRVQDLFDEVYVDEIQDNKLLELDLLLTLVRNPHGIHFAGDTAQCISRDNTFRFDDVKVRFYQHFIAMAEKAGKPNWAKPRLLTLAKNYRSHQGILSLSADIVEMLYNGFPGQIDKLPREIGSHPGAKPTVFLGFDHRLLAQGGAGIAGTEEGISSFGADQVIIVRNDSAKEALRNSLKSALILTVLQSKGLEFEDVILYGFFSDTLWDNLRPRSLQLLMRSDTAQQLDKQKYGGLCSELKHLYVAVTRARKNLWIVESNPDSAHNMVALWTTIENGREPLVSVVRASDWNAEAIARGIIKPGRSTNPAAWRNQGELLLHRGLYQDALFCFTRANHKQGVVLAMAYQYYEDASALDVKGGTRDGKTAKDLYGEAAQHFKEAGFIQKAAESWGCAGEYRKAAALLEAHAEYGKAATWYEKAGGFLDAAGCFQKAAMYDDAVKAYRKGEHFAELVTFLQSYQDYISKDVRVRYSTLVNLLLQRGDLQLPETLVPDVIRTLGQDTEIEDFYNKYEKTGDLMALYEEKERYYDAFKLAISKGKLEDALRLGLLEGALKEGCERSIPGSEFLILANGLVMEYTWVIAKLLAANNSGIDVPLMFRNTVNNSAMRVLQEPRLEWERILHSVRNPVSNLKYGRLDSDGSCVKSTEFGNDVLDFLELMHLAANYGLITKVNSFSELPISTLSRFAIIGGDLLAKKPPSANLLACAGAMAFSHLPGQVMVFNWSPLCPKDPDHQSQDNGHMISILPMAKAQDDLTAWLIPIVSRVIPEALRQIRDLFHRVESPCFFALQGVCRVSECKKGRHTKLSADETKPDTLSLLEGIRLSCASARLYYYRKLKESDSKDYLPLRRNLLEKLLKELTFISPLLNDSVVQQEFWDMILAEEQWLHVRDGLASLFFHRLDPNRRPEELEKRGRYSALLEERSIASKIGVMTRFMRFLKWNDPWWGGFIHECNYLQPPHISCLGVKQLIDTVSRVTSQIIGWNAFGLRSFHSVLSLFESVSLELMNRTIPLDIIVPFSRREFIQDRENTCYPTEGERLALNSCLIEVLGRLCEILLYFAEEHQRHQMTPISDNLFEACGSRLWDGNRYMIRRSLDHLALCMVNLSVGRILPKGFGELWEQIRKAIAAWEFLRPPTLINWVPKPEQLAYSLFSVYRKYNKDELVIIPKPKGHSRFQFLAIRVYSVQKEEIEESPKAQDPPIGGVLEHQDEVNAISKIIRWWKRCSERINKEKERATHRAILLASGVRGQAEVLIDDIILCASRPRYWYQKQILGSSGVALLAGILELGNIVDSAHQRAIEGLTDTRGKYKLSSASVEDIQDMIGNLQKRKRYLAKTTRMFSNKKEAQALLDLDPEQLQGKMDTALKTLSLYQQEVEKWGREIEDCLDGGLMY